MQLIADAASRRCAFQQGAGFVLHRLLLSLHYTQPAFFATSLLQRPSNGVTKHATVARILNMCPAWCPILCKPSVCVPTLSTVVNASLPVTSSLSLSRCLSMMF